MPAAILNLMLKQFDVFDNFKFDAFGNSKKSTPEQIIYNFRSNQIRAAIKLEI